MTVHPIRAARIFDGHRWHDDAALLVQDGRVAGIVPAAEAANATQAPGWIGVVTTDNRLLIFTPQGSLQQEITIAPLPAP